ncbi:hypothetical protein pipiens_012886 [Culex pipiens pipiens]|uniref:Uncharacterized protein n=1 Tax=Culex pipiens pipiens TaxID=38569 RepID=A0ABD1D0M6_CULPP
MAITFHINTIDHFPSTPTPTSPSFERNSEKLRSFNLLRQQLFQQQQRLAMACAIFVPTSSQAFLRWLQPTPQPTTNLLQSIVSKYDMSLFDAFLFPCHGAPHLATWLDDHIQLRRTDNALKTDHSFIGTTSLVPKAISIAKCHRLNQLTSAALSTVVRYLGQSLKSTLEPINRQSSVASRITDRIQGVCPEEG